MVEEVCYHGDGYHGDGYQDTVKLWVECAKKT